MKLTVEKEFLVILISMSDDVEFQTRFLLSDIEQLINKEKKELLKVSDSENQASGIIRGYLDYIEYGDDLQ